jgi:hypothetical protein
MSIGNCIIFHNTTVQEEIFMGIGSIQKITFRKFCFLEKWIWYKLKKRGKKQKAFGACRNGDQERSGSESCRIQSQEDQELSRSATAPTLISQTSGVTQSVDLTNQVLGNHYLRSSRCFRTAVCVRGQYLWAAQKHNEFERQPSLSGLVHDTVRAHFVRPLRRLSSWNTLTIPTETLALSIAAEKYTVVSW